MCTHISLPCDLLHRNLNAYFSLVSGSSEQTTLSHQNSNVYFTLNSERCTHTRLSNTTHASIETTHAPINYMSYSTNSENCTT